MSPHDISPSDMTSSHTISGPCPACGQRVTWATWHGARLPFTRVGTALTLQWVTTGLGAQYVPQWSNTYQAHQCQGVA
jgi:hypothetical protein